MTNGAEVFPMVDLVRDAAKPVGDRDFPWGAHHGKINVESITPKSRSKAAMDSITDSIKRNASQRIVEEAIHRPLTDFAHQCHAASVALVESGLLQRYADGEPIFVARGRARGIMSQHSWVTVGTPYDPTTIVDLTMWSYNPCIDTVRILDGADASSHYVPHGLSGENASEALRDMVLEMDPIHLDVSDPQAAAFLRGRVLDVRAWMKLFSCNVSTYPARAIIEAAHRNDRLRALIPIDLVGMLTEINVGGAYPRLN